MPLLLARVAAPLRAPLRRGLTSLSVSEIRKILDDRGVDYRDCIEKAQLLQRLEESHHRVPPKSPEPMLNEAERTVVDLFHKCAPSVGFIQTSVLAQQSPLEMKEVPRGAGSGFVWDAAGHVVTNFHVVRNVSRAKVSFNASSLTFDAEAVGYEADKDIAVLKVLGDAAQLAQLRPLAVGTSSGLLVGQSVIAIGNPFGLDGSLTTGVISALGREVMGVAGRPIKNCVQTDAAINPGNSGGPLINSRGEVIGVNTAIFSPSGASAGIGFAIPIDTVRRIVSQVIKYGRTLRPAIGLNVADEMLKRSVGRQLNRELTGVLVLECPPGTPAHAAGIQGTFRNTSGSITLGDLIVSVNGIPMRISEDLLSAIEEVPLNSKVDMTLWRNCNPDRVEHVQVMAVDRAQFQS